MEGNVTRLLPAVSARGSLTYAFEEIEEVLPGFVFYLFGIEPHMRSHGELVMGVGSWDWKNKTGKGMRSVGRAFFSLSRTLSFSLSPPLSLSLGRVECDRAGGREGGGETNGR